MANSEPDPGVRRNAQGERGCAGISTAPRAWTAANLLDVAEFDHPDGHSRTGVFIAMISIKELRAMSHRSVQLLIGQLFTDEELRLRFVQDPQETLAAWREQGFEFTPGEVEALLQTDRKVWNSTAARIHPRLQRCSLRSK